jgi:uncharacterized peroxidase-related enzyme
MLNDALLADLKHDPTTVPLKQRERVLVDYAIKLTRAPSSVDEDDIYRLCHAGLTDEAIHTAASIVAYFNFVNRIALGLGVELEST